MERLYFVGEVVKILGITNWTLINWYQWERIALENGEITERVLPCPERLAGIKGRPRVWTIDQIQQLIDFKGSIVRGRHGKMGKVTNPKSRHAKNK